MLALYDTQYVLKILLLLPGVAHSSALTVHKKSAGDLNQLSSVEQQACI